MARERAQEESQEADAAGHKRAPAEQGCDSRRCFGRAAGGCGKRVSGSTAGQVAGAQAVWEGAARGAAEQHRAAEARAWD